MEWKVSGKIKCKICVTGWWIKKLLILFVVLWLVNKTVLDKVKRQYINRQWNNLIYFIIGKTVYENQMKNLIIRAE